MIREDKDCLDRIIGFCEHRITKLVYYGGVVILAVYVTFKAFSLNNKFTEEIAKEKDLTRQLSIEGKDINQDGLSDLVITNGKGNSQTFYNYKGEYLTYKQIRQRITQEYQLWQEKEISKQMQKFLSTPNRE